LVNEDFPAHALSPRNVCLDAVVGSDIYILLLGSRGGSRAPSGKLMVEEEYEEAKKRGIPVLIFLEETERDSGASLLENKVSDYLHGGLRKKYSSESELREAVKNALAPLIGQLIISSMDPNLVQQAILEPPKMGQEATVTLALAPTRDNEVIDPVTLESPQFADGVYRLAHEPEIRLLSYSKSKTHSIQGRAFMIRQGGNSSPKEEAIVTVHENGLITVTANVTGRNERNQEILSGYAISEEDVRHILRTVLSFARAFYDQHDPYQRYHSFLYAVSLANAGHRRIEKDVSPRKSYTMSYQNKDVILAFDEPRKIDRSVMSNPEHEVDRVITLLQRQLNQD